MTKPSATFIIEWQKTWGSPILHKNVSKTLQVQSYKLHNNKYMIDSTQLTNAEVFLFIAVLVLKLLSRKVLFINRKKQKKLLKRTLLFKILADFRSKLLQNCK